MSLMQPWLGLHKEQKFLQKVGMRRFSSKHLVFFQESSYGKHMPVISLLQQVL
ncbi:hypothetical protein BHE74_00047394 [Ensete ventricosum]|uniref:Uncharacterized protein n=1 Tax=Ensete ventricosum TaxID=4639 RepID=A0A444EB81_ENSVE|nr:hypothetical protein B296_00045446 [Ensete ventricosum]RWW07625.1 hypothetical protein GW17_00028984 [Ensete ventricosum]RWW46668.1 hypothetical protein BHE74_00047394 [Ensete ventricosum]RZS20570.1 hypothetical protein BHM03_00053100 [Ensete ventricosum]